MSTEHPILIDLQDVVLHGRLTIPERACEIVVFANGSGENRFTRRHHEITSAFNGVGVASLLVDLLTPSELGNPNRYLDDRRSDVSLLAHRLVKVIDWASKFEDTAPLFLGLYTVGIVAAAGLIAAAERPGKVMGVVAQSGRPDLAGDAIGHLETPTMFIVGDLDERLIEINREVQKKLNCENDLRVIPGAFEGFSNPTTLDEVERAAIRWFDYYVAPGLLAAG